MDLASGAARSKYVSSRRCPNFPINRLYSQTDSLWGGAHGSWQLQGMLMRRGHFFSRSFSKSSGLTQSHAYP